MSISLKKRVDILNLRLYTRIQEVQHPFGLTETILWEQANAGGQRNNCIL